MSTLQPDIEVTKGMAARKAVVFEATMPLAAIISGDENMIVTVVRNLLANAVKFTATGGNVTLAVLSDSGASSYTISVTDTGTGMSPEQIQNLFRLDRKQSRTGTAGERCRIGINRLQGITRKTRQHAAY